MKLLTVALAVMLLAGCASSSGGGTAGSRSERLITADEIAATHAKNAYEVIEQLRPRWLTRINQAVVYMDDAPLILPLNSVMVGEIQQMEFLNAADATTKYGTNHAGGAIVIKRKWK
jgi:hypothetical protein